MKNLSTTSPTSSTLTDEKILELCSHYGKLALHYRRKFVGLLPEVNRRKLYKKKGFNSIFEFAFKLAGLSEAQVKLAISLDQNFADKPILHKALTSGKTSMNKLVRIASVATVENQRFLAHQVELLPNRALETLVRDIKVDTEKFFHVKKNGNQNGFLKPKHDSNVDGPDVSVSLTKLQNLHLSSEVITKLSELQNKGIDINELILNLLKEREEKIENEKAEISERTRTKENSEIARAKKPSRYISVRTKKLLRSIHGTKCAVPHCPKSAEEIHHTVPFALNKSHDPRYLAPLCREHHTIAHSINNIFHQKRKVR